jgi:ketosteroid isomerase-like protein
MERVEPGAETATGSGRPRSSNAWRRILSEVVAVNDPAHIRRALRTYVESWETDDVSARLALFSDDVVVEDPATAVRARGKTQLREYLSAGIPSNWTLAFSFDRVAVVADEAILTYRILMEADTAAPAELLVNAHASFDSDGLIRSFRTFFDVDAISDSPQVR